MKSRLDNSVNFLDVSELDNFSGDFNDIVTLFKTLRRWKTEESAEAETESVEPNLPCEN